MKKKISSKENDSFSSYECWISIRRKPNITKHREGPNLINFEKEVRDAAFDEEVPPLKVMRNVEKIE